MIEQKIREISLSGYFNQYNINVFLYSATGRPLDGVDTTSFSMLINQYNNATFETEYDGVYFVSTPRGEFLRKYVVLIPIQKSEATVGYVFISLLLKRVIPENVYPELLVDSRFQKDIFARTIERFKTCLRIRCFQFQNMAIERALCLRQALPKRRQMRQIFVTSIG